MVVLLVAVVLAVVLGLEYDPPSVLDSQRIESLSRVEHEGVPRSPRDPALPLEQGADTSIETLQVPADPTPGDALHLYGRLVEGSGYPIGGGVVRLHGDALPVGSYEAVTDEAGRFEIIEAGHAGGSDGGSGRFLSARAIGYCVITVPLAGDERQRDFGEIVLPPDSVLVGRVVGGEGDPLPGASVLACQRIAPSVDRRWAALSSFFEVETGLDGRFEIVGLRPSGAIEVSVRAQNKCALGLSVEPEGRRSTDLGEIVLANGGMLSGRVATAGGQPIEGATILLRPGDHSLPRGVDTAYRDSQLVTNSSTGSIQQSTTSDENGEFSFEGVGLSAYSVIASKKGFDPQQQTITPGEGPVRLTLDPEALVALMVLDDATGEPLPEAEVTFKRCSRPDARPCDDESDPILWTLAGPDAARHLGRESSGSGLVVAGPAGRVRTSMTIRCAGFVPVTDALPGVVPGEVLERTVRLVRGGRMLGRVGDESGAPLARAELSFRSSESASVVLRGLSSPEGDFDVQGFSEGTWMVSAQLAGYVPCPEFPVEVVESHLTEGVRVVLSEAGSIAGRLSEADGRPGIDRKVVIIPRTLMEGLPSAWPAWTDYTGSFSMEGLWPGEYRVTSAPGGDTTVVVAAGEAAQADLRLRRPPRLSGRVWGPDGQPAVAEVVAMRGSYRDLQIRTDVEGRYLFEQLPVGLTTVFASTEEATTSRLKIDLQWDQDDVLDLRFSRTRLIGRVVDAKQRTPVRGALVKVQTAEDDRRWRVPFQVEKCTGPDGTFLFQDLSPGPYRIEVRHEDYVPADALAVDQVAGETTVEDVVLHRGGVLRGFARAPGLADSRSALWLALTHLDGGGSHVAGGPVSPNAAFRISGIPPGEYRYLVKDMARFYLPMTKEWASGTVRVDPVRDTLLDLVLVSPEP
ncbi:MAG: carboxypeptidase regulatory-like domain-containing protein [Planctomycetes bacterium]|nr:carboxypeptidase regulatory-like domain-containing protein [Planctomycetota bacterium]